MKKKQPDFAVGDVVIFHDMYEGEAVAMVTNMEENSFTSKYEFWLRDLWTQPGVPLNNSWWTTEEELELLASSVALAKRYCGYKED